MANKKFTDLNATTSLVGTDLIAVTVDPATTPVSKKSTISTLMAQAPVQSVNTATGAVVLDADDIDDTSTTNKFVTSADITNLSNQSGTNSGDVTLATVANNYLSLSGQEITAGVVPVSLGGTGSGDLATARANLGLGTAATTASSDYATAAQGTLADSATQPADNVSTLTNDSGYITGVTAGELGDFDFDDNAILGFSASKNDQTGTTYTVVASDNGKVVVLNNASAITVDIDTGLPAGFNCSFVQKGAGQVSFAGTATVNNRQSHTKINGQYGVASIVAYDTDTYILAGDTAP